MAELILGHFYIRLDNAEYGREKFIVGGLENSPQNAAQRGWPCSQSFLLAIKIYDPLAFGKFARFNRFVRFAQCTILPLYFQIRGLNRANINSQ